MLETTSETSSATQKTPYFGITMANLCYFKIFQVMTSLWYRRERVMFEKTSGTSSTAQKPPFPFGINEAS